MDATLPPYDDIRVRQAFKLVLDRQEILEVVYAGQGDIACDNSVWKNDPYYHEQDCPRDVERAVELLAEAGYPDGLDVELFVADVYPSYVPLAVAFKEQAAEAGIRGRDQPGAFRYILLRLLEESAFLPDVVGPAPGRTRHERALQLRFAQQLPRLVQ